jgi:hypothetical protein
MTRHNSQFTTQTEDDSRRDAEAQRKERKTQEKGKQGFCAPAEDKEKQEVSRDRGGPKYETEDLAQRRRDAGGDRKGDWELRNSGIEELTDIVGVPDRIKPKSMVSRRGAGARGKARTSECVSRNGATHANKKK